MKKMALKVMRETLEKEINLLREKVLGQLENKTEMIEMFVKELLDCKGHVLTSGVGTSAFTAARFSHLLSCSGIPSIFLNPATMLHGGSGAIKSEDVVVLISKGGESDEMINLARISKKRGATVICLTERKESSLAKESDLIVEIKVSGADIKSTIATGSSLAFSLFLDGICGIIVEELGYDPEKFKIIHPGGAVGKMLKGGKK